MKLVRVNDSYINVDALTHIAFSSSFRESLPFRLYLAFGAKDYEMHYQTADERDADLNRVLAACNFTVPLPPPEAPHPLRKFEFS